MRNLNIENIKRKIVWEKIWKIFWPKIVEHMKKISDDKSIPNGNDKKIFGIILISWCHILINSNPDQSCEINKNIHIYNDMWSEIY